MTRGLLDTSVLIAHESGRGLRAEAMPDETALSVITLAELEAGVLAARDIETRSRRMATLQLAASTFAPQPIDAAVASQWARLRSRLAEEQRRANVNDLWIAATAAAAGIPVVAQDDDFDVLAELGLLDVVRV